MQPRISNMPTQTLIYSLGYLGLVPFLVTLLALISGQTWFLVDNSRLFGTYSAVILSFLGGVLWGRSISLNSQAAKYLFLFSNGIALLAWLSLLLVEAFSSITLGLLITGYAALLLTEYVGYQRFLKDVDKGYLTMRINLTSLVILAHLIALPYFN
jgi:hypothetical protein